MKAAAPNKLKINIIKNGVLEGTPLTMISSQAMVDLPAVKRWAEHFAEKYGVDMPPVDPKVIQPVSAAGRPGPGASEVPDPEGSSTPDPGATGTPKMGAPGTVPIK